MRHLFILLIGALLFSLSSLPGNKPAGHAFGRLELASETNDDLGGCDLIGGLSAGDDSGCEFDQDMGGGKTVKGRLSGKVHTVAPGVNNLTDEKTPGGKQVTITLELETECKDCGGTSNYTTSFTRNAKDIAQVQALINTKFKDGKKALADNIAAAKKKKEDDKKLAQDKKDCLVDENGDEVTDTLKCQVKNMKKMKGTEAADYYEANVKGQIEALLSSNVAGDRAKGMELLRQVGSSSNPAVRQSLAMLKRFGTFQQQSATKEQQLRNLQAMYPNDPRVAAMIQQFEMTQQQGAAFFQQQGIDVQGNGNGTNNLGLNSLGLNGAFGSNPFDYSAIVGNHALMLGQSSPLGLNTTLGLGGRPGLPQEYQASVIGNPQLVRSGIQQRRPVYGPQRPTPLGPPYLPPNQQGAGYAPTYTQPYYGSSSFVQPQIGSQYATAPQYLPAQQSGNAPTQLPPMAH